MVHALDYIRKTYKVPAKKGSRIKFGGKPATITGARGPHLIIRLDESPDVKRLIHPTWEVEYEPAQPEAQS